MRVPWSAFYARVGGLAVWRLAQPFTNRDILQFIPCKA